MGDLVEFLANMIARPLLKVVLGIFGYDMNWDPADGSKRKGKRLVFSAIFCFLLSGAVLGGLIWVVWFFVDKLNLDEYLKKTV